MLKNQQNLGQRLQQGLQQKLSPQQLQYIKLLQLPTIALEQRIKEEMEINPVLEEADDQDLFDQPDLESSQDENEDREEALEQLDERDVDWDDFDDNTEYDGET